MRERLIIVSSEKPNLYDYLSRQLTGDVRILADRRRGERRHEVHQWEGTERRQCDRRHQPDAIPRTDWFLIPPAPPPTGSEPIQRGAPRRLVTTGRPPPPG